jgi:hypothetical protein
MPNPGSTRGRIGPDTRDAAQRYGAALFSIEEAARP